MVTYISLINFTDQGLRSVKETTKRADAAKEAARKFGINMKEVYWTLGDFDLVAVIEAPDDATYTAFGLSLGAAGNLRSQSLRAFNKEEMNAILAKMG